MTDELLPPIAQRLDDWKADFDHFVNVTVPTTIENQSGRVTRHLIKSQETFEIDNTKLMKREKKIVERFEARCESDGLLFALGQKAEQRGMSMWDMTQRIAEEGEGRAALGTFTLAQLETFAAKEGVHYRKRALNYLVEAVGSDLYSAQRKHKPLESFELIKAVKAAIGHKLKLKATGGGARP